MSKELKEYSWCEMVRWLSHEMQEEEGYWGDALKSVENKYEPEGFMLLENQLMDSSRFGHRYVLPFGGLATYQEPPDHPFSYDGTASGTVCVVGIYKPNKENGPDTDRAD